MSQVEFFQIYSVLCVKKKKEMLAIPQAAKNAINV